MTEIIQQEQLIEELIWTTSENQRSSITSFVFSDKLSVAEMSVAKISPLPKTEMDALLLGRLDVSSYKHKFSP